MSDLSTIPTAATATAPAPVPGTSTTGRTIIDALTADGRFTTLASALTVAGLIETLKGPGPFTVFAPTDDAFKALPAGLLDGLLKDKARLTSILTFHVVPGRLNAVDLRALVDAKGRGTVKTVEGRPLAVHVDKATMQVAGETPVTVGKELGAGNGVIHIIDGVLLPSR